MRPLTERQAAVVWAILRDTCGATREDGFTQQQSREVISEWRFMGALGFGGKFWRNWGRRPDGTWGECWYVNCYREDETGARRELIEAANASLWPLLRDAEATP